MNNITILIVDDDYGHAVLVQKNLIRGGINNKMIHLDNGNSALDFVFKRGEYKDHDNDDHLFILLDINMPGLDGVEVLRQIKENPKTKMIPVVMLTTTDNPDEVNHCYENGYSVYLKKPIEPNKFIEAIKALGLFISVVSPPKRAVE
jgi:CheY-like chemotaxis protein